MSLMIFKYSRKRPFKRRQYHARIEDAHNGEPMWRTTEGYNNRADRDHAIDVLFTVNGVVNVTVVDSDAPAERERVL